MKPINRHRQAAECLLAATEKLVWLETSQGVAEDEFDDAIDAACEAIAYAKANGVRVKLARKLAGGAS